MRLITNIIVELDKIIRKREPKFWVDYGYMYIMRERIDKGMNFYLSRLDNYELELDVDSKSMVFKFKSDVYKIDKKHNLIIKFKDDADFWITKGYLCDFET